MQMYRAYYVRKQRLEDIASVYDFLSTDMASELGEKI